MEEEKQFAGKLVVQRRPRMASRRRMYCSMGCVGGNLNKSSLGQPVVRMSYHSGTASS